MTRLSPAERRRRKARRAWIPTGIIGGLILVAAAVAVVIQVTGVGRISAPTTGFSTFDRRGILAIQSAENAQVDVRTPLSAATVRLPGTTTRTVLPAGDVSLEVDLTGTSGVESIYVDSLTLVTRGGSVVTVSTKAHDTGYLFIHKQLESYSVLGLSTAQMAAFENAMPNGAGGPSSYFTLAVGDANGLGVPTRVSVQCAGPKGCIVSTVTTLPQH